MFTVNLLLASIAVFPLWTVLSPYLLMLSQPLTAASPSNKVVSSICDRAVFHQKPHGYSKCIKKFKKIKKVLSVLYEMV